MKAHRLSEGGWFVQGTDDKAEALDFLLRVYAEEIADLVCYDIAEDQDYDIRADYAVEGLWRYVPCSPQSCGEHGWHLHHASKRGRGVFPGVQFDDLVAEPIEYDDGLDKDPWLEETVTTSDHTEERVSA